MPDTKTPSSLSLEDVARALQLSGVAALAELKPSDLFARTQKDLLEIAKILQLDRTARLRKDALLARIWEVLESRGAFGPPPPSREAETTGPRDQNVVHGEEPSSGPGLTHKFELGQTAQPSRIPEHIPWGYGFDRVTAMPVDPDRLFAYWELTDDSIAAARKRLGAGGDGAWLSLRVYDTTGRIFDGNNAWSYFDHSIERDQRHWFFLIGKPTSEVIVEIGLKSHEGFFAKIARTSRVEFPRKTPVDWSEPEWITVRGGHVEHHPAVAPPPQPQAPGEVAQAVVAPPSAVADERAWSIELQKFELFSDDSFQEILSSVTGVESLGAFERWEEVASSELPEGLKTATWEGPVTRTTWAAGPFSHGVDMPRPEAVVWVGPNRVYRSGDRVTMVEGPWHVTIKGLAGRRGHRVLSRWQVFRSWGRRGDVASLLGDGRAQIAGTAYSRGIPGMSGRALGASDRWQMGSEERLGGASEQLFIGASEMSFGGSSEQQFAGSSERQYGGASERSFGGASERLQGGGSEPRLAAFPPVPSNKDKA